MLYIYVLSFISIYQNLRKVLWNVNTVSNYSFIHFASISFVLIIIYPPISPMLSTYAFMIHLYHLRIHTTLTLLILSYFYSF